MNDDDLDIWMKENASDGIHISCSCAMGSATTSQGTIPGAPGLRICDSSVMPTVPRANTHAAQSLWPRRWPNSSYKTMRKTLT